MNFNDFKKDGNILVPGAPEDLLAQCEQSSGIVFPEDYKSLLRFTDGCLLKNVTFVIFFSCGSGFHPKETLAFANSGLNDVGMYFIGRFAGDMFGYLKGGEDQKIYSFFEETGEKTFEADNLDDFASKYLVPKTRKGLWSQLFSS